MTSTIGRVCATGGIVPLVAVSPAMRALVPLAQADALAITTCR